MSNTQLPSALISGLGALVSQLTAAGIIQNPSLPFQNTLAAPSSIARAADTNVVAIAPTTADHGSRSNGAMSIANSIANGHTPELGRALIVDQPPNVARSSRVIQEQRRLFQRRTAASQRRGPYERVREQTWTRDFCCLANVGVTNVKNLDYSKLYLAGLGKLKVSLPKTASANEVEEILYTHFPRLRLGSGVRLLKRLAGSKYELEKLSDGCVPVQMMEACTARGMLFICPLQKQLPDDPLPERLAYRRKRNCEICNLEMFEDEIAQHTLLSHEDAVSDIISIHSDRASSPNDGVMNSSPPGSPRPSGLRNLVLANSMPLLTPNRSAVVGTRDRSPETPVSSARAESVARSAATNMGPAESTVAATNGALMNISQPAPQSIEIPANLVLDVFTPRKLRHIEHGAKAERKQLRQELLGESDVAEAMIDDDFKLKFSIRTFNRDLLVQDGLREFGRRDYNPSLVLKVICLGHLEGDFIYWVVDQGGPRRMFLQAFIDLLADDLVNPDGSVKDGATTAELKKFGILGRAVGSAIVQEGILPTFFSPESWRQIVFVDATTKPSVSAINKGLEEVRVLQFLKSHPVLCAFCCHALPLTTGRLYDMLPDNPVDGHFGGNLYMMKSNSFMWLKDFIDECADGIAVPNAVAAGVTVPVVKLDNLYAWLTGSHRHFLGAPKLSIHFKDAGMPHVRTCNYELHLPYHYETYEKFRDAFAYAVVLTEDEFGEA